MTACSHLAGLEALAPRPDGGEECRRDGGRWVHLRARGPLETTGHPVIASAEPGETWRWCYEDQPFLPGEQP